MLKIAFITRTRQELADTIRIIASNMKSDALVNSKKPILWSNHGTLGCGKRLIVDTVIEETTQIRPVRLLGGQYFSHGASTFILVDIFNGNPSNKNFQQTSTIDEVRTHFKFPPSELLIQSRLSQTQPNQASGGILFVHNAPEAARQRRVDVDLYLGKELEEGTLCNGMNAMPITSEKLDEYQLSPLFRRSINSYGSEPWVRFVELTIHNSQIFNSSFIKKLKLISAMDQTRQDVHKNKMKLVA
jgi:hypothetical protein